MTHANSQSTSHVHTHSPERHVEGERKSKPLPFRRPWNRFADQSAWRDDIGELVSPRWARKVSWTDRTIYNDLPRDKIKESPEWSPEGALKEEAVITQLPSEPPRPR